VQEAPCLLLTQSGHFISSLSAAIFRFPYGSQSFLAVASMAKKEISAKSQRVDQDNRTAVDLLEHRSLL